MIDEKTLLESIAKTVETQKSLENLNKQIDNEMNNRITELKNCHEKLDKLQISLSAKVAQYNYLLGTAKENINDIADLFSVIGRVVVVKEKLINAITAVSGSGPAYVFYFSEVMRQAAENLGIPADMAKELVYQTIFGSGKMLIESGLDDTVLRKNVTSPGGTTEKAMEEFLNSDFKQVVFSAIEKAKQRAEEL